MELKPRHLGSVYTVAIGGAVLFMDASPSLLASNGLENGQQESFQGRKARAAH